MVQITKNKIVIIFLVFALLFAFIQKILYNIIGECNE